jgi:ribosomal protein S18 acetylase RimI-like enzyme
MMNEKNTIEVSAAQLSDIPRIVDIHTRAFKGFFLTSLGEHFLRLYYDSVRTSSDGILLKCERYGELIGFCAATIKSAGFNKRLIMDRLVDYMLMGMRLSFTRPKALWRLFRNFSKESAKEGDTGDYAELLSIGVDPDVQGSGAGKLLLKSLETEVKKRNGQKLSLTTDYYDNEKAVGFYHALGYQEWYDFVTYPQRRMYRMIKSL